jgi:two-component system nitrate/nitrite response regulator NarL
MDVVLVEDHRLLAQAVALSLDARGTRCRVVDVARLGSVEAVLDDVLSDGSAAVWLDLDLDTVGDGGRLVAPLTAAGHPVLVVTGEADEARWGSALLAGAAGVLPKSTPLPVMLAALARVVRGEPVHAPHERDRLVRCARVQAAQERRLRAPLDRLTPREAEVLRQLGDGVPAAGIAEREVVAETTVRAHIRAVLRKLEVSSQLQAVAAARRAGWLQPPRPG